ncbi:NADH-quinone oxidoreductase subunit G [Helicobacter baculiformis]|uniref:NADH-quinone oxidoreductase subunit G n=1 Tax=Helicobacter baculiformis TaxID=427351 RepID=A0ABV7ZHU1_9HELI
MMVFNIDGQEIAFQEGQTILEAARSAGVYIPAICYLSGCSPTVACKMCMVEVDGKRVYGCNTKAKPNTHVCTNTKEIVAERKMIMQTYDVNHPLECGVCDKSGECELQDMTMRMQVETQPFAVRDNLKPFAFWAQASYDPNLCIMCERCVTTCSDNIGDSNLKALKADLHAPDKFKASMPKDPFSVWSRKQKGMIGFVGDTPCFDCGECIAVCPVGAIVYKDFSYSANAWELKRIDSTCAHCAAGCFISYEVRHFDTLGDDLKIFRVGNDFYHNPICGAGRFAFDVHASPKGSAHIEQAVQKLQEAKVVYIGGDASNEEAYLVEHLRQKLGFKLINEEVRAFQNFLNILQPSAFGDLEDIKHANLILTLGSKIRTENPLMKYAIANALKVNKGSALIYAHPIKDKAITKMSRAVLSLTHAPHAEEIVLGAFLHALGLEHPSLQPLLESLSEGEKPHYTMLESIGLALGDFEKMQALIAKASKIVLIAGQELYTHPKASNIASLLKTLSARCPVILVPPSTNALGIASICTLDTPTMESPSVGIRTKGDYTLDCDNKGAHRVDFILPSFNQLEASLTNFEGRLLPIRPALRFEGFDLSDIAQYFGCVGESLVDYTHMLPQEKGYQPIAYDTLKNFYSNDKCNHRGYKLNPPLYATQEPPSAPIQAILPSEFNAYCKYPETQFGTPTLQSANLQLKAGVYVSAAHLEKLGLEEGACVRLKKGDLHLEGAIYVDHSLEQEIFMVSPNLDTQGIFAQGLFSTLELERV